MEDRVKIDIIVLILLHLYKTISIVISSLNDGPNQKSLFLTIGIDFLVAGHPPRLPTKRAQGVKLN